MLKLIQIALLLAFTSAELMAVNTFQESVLPDSTNFQDSYHLEKIDSLSERRSLLESTGQVDPSLGFTFIEYVTSNNIESYYEEAVEFYFWSLNSDRPDHWREVFEKEIDRLEPLMDRTIISRWRNQLMEGSSELLNEIGGFWEQKDFIRRSETNLRLIEHWERIAYAKKNFPGHGTHPLGIDDRGIIYIKYGEPTLRQNGRFQVDMHTIRTWVRRFVESYNHAGLPSTMNPANEEWIRNKSLETLSNHNHSTFEVWLYHQVQPDNLPLFFLFAERSNDRFVRLNGPEDFIPEEAYRSRYHDPFPVTSALILQLLYYEQLIPLHPFFADGYENIASRFIHNPISMQDRTAQNLKARNQSNYNSFLNRADLEVSSYENLLEEIPFRIKKIRTLDENNIPQLRLLTFSKPRESVLLDISKHTDQSTGFNYQVRHNLRVFDPDWNKLADYTRTLPIPETGFLGSSETNHAFTMFQLPYLPYITNGHVELSCEVYRRSPENGYSIKDILERTTGYCKEFVEFPEPLQTDPGILEMSDIVLGYGLDASDSDSQLMPFVITPDNKIPEGENLSIHFEVFDP